jgi:hypothetical protein
MLQEAADRLLQQSDDAMAQIWIAGAGLVEKSIPLGGVAQLACGGEYFSFVHGGCAGSRRPPTFSAYSAR